MASTSDWSEDTRGKEIIRIAKGIEWLVKFSYPVYFNDQLKIIKSQLENQFYRSVSAVLVAVDEQIYHNAKQLNHRGSEIVRRAQLIRDVLKRYIGDPSCSDIDPVYLELNDKCGESAVAEDDSDEVSLNDDNFNVETREEETDEAEKDETKRRSTQSQRIAAAEENRKSTRKRSRVICEEEEDPQAKWESRNRGNRKWKNRWAKAVKLSSEPRKPKQHATLRKEKTLLTHEWKEKWFKKRFKVGEMPEETKFRRSARIQEMQ